MHLHFLFCRGLSDKNAGVQGARLPVQGDAHDGGAQVRIVRLVRARHSGVREARRHTTSEGVLPAGGKGGPPVHGGRVHPPVDARDGGAPLRKVRGERGRVRVRGEEEVPALPTGVGGGRGETGPHGGRVLRVHGGEAVRCVRGVQARDRVRGLRVETVTRSRAGMQSDAL